jgi:hypothetical protein
MCTRQATLVSTMTSDDDATVMMHLKKRNLGSTRTAKAFEIHAEALEGKW